MNRKSLFPLLLGTGLLLYGWGIGSAQAQTHPYTAEELADLLAGGRPTGHIAAFVRLHCLSFRIDEATTRRLRSAGADERLLTELREACFQAETGSPAGAPDRPPAAVDTLPDQQLTAGAGALEIDLAAYYVDPEGGPLEFTVGSTPVHALRVDVASGTLRLTPIGAGLARVTVSALDEEGAFAEWAFEVLIRDAGPPAGPAVAGTPPPARSPLQLNRTTALTRSLIPGMGQFYKREPVKGALFLAAGGLSVAGATLATRTFNRKAEAFVELQAEAVREAAAAHPSEEKRIYTSLAAEHRSVEQWKDRRNLLIASAAGLWAINLIDSALGFPRTIERSASGRTYRVDLVDPGINTLNERLAYRIGVRLTF